MADPRDDLLAANAAFYRALAEGDIRAMEGLWAHVAPIACIHPGWHVLSGRRAVMESWRAILAGTSAAGIRCIDPRAHDLGSAGFVTCYEVAAQASLVATNVFVMERDAWRLVHHQSGPTTLPPSMAAPRASGAVH